MFDRILDKVLEFLGWFTFWTVVREFERGVILRLGSFHREVGPDDGVALVEGAEWIRWRRLWRVQLWRPRLIYGRPTGLHWVLPFAIDDALVDNVVPRTVSLSAQSLTTKDGKQIVVSAVVTAAISNIRKALLKVEGVDHALMDSCYAAIASAVSHAEWGQLATDEFNENLTKACRAQAWRYGIEIERVQLSDLSLCRSIRLHATNHYSAPLGHE